MEKKIVIRNKGVEKQKGTFFKTLSFEREVQGSKEKIAYFTDKFDKSSKVITTWGGIVPGLRYSCQLEITDMKDDEKDVIIYKLLKYRVWIDKLDVILLPGNSVNVTLDGKEVDELTFNLDESTDYETKIEELREYFSQKTFQLRDKQEIAKFVTSYGTACEILYGVKKKEVIKSVSKSKKMEKIM
jgi:hypothetical protein